MMFLETSAKTGANVDGCFMSVVEEVMSRVECGDVRLESQSLGLSNASVKKKGCCG